MGVTNSMATGHAVDPPAGRVRVLVIEPAAGRRRVIRTTLVGDDGLEIFAMATSLADARDHLRPDRPDVLVTSAVRDALVEVLELARSFGDLPVVTLESDRRTHDPPPRGAAVIPRAGQPAGRVRSATDATLVEVLRGIVAPADPPPDRRRRTVAQPAAPPAYRWNGRILLIGASTGGVDAIQRVLAGFPPNCPPTLIVQHMPAVFLASFAERLNQIVAPEVRLAQDGGVLEQGTVLIAPGGACHTVIDGGTPPRCRLVEQPKQNGHRPSVDVTFDSAQPIAGQVLAVLMTGMGRDGASAMLRLREAGARTLAQDSASSIVWGMPGAAWDEGAAEDLVALGAMADRLLGLCSHDTPATIGLAPYG